MPACAGPSPKSPSAFVGPGRMKAMEMLPGIKPETLTHLLIMGWNMPREKSLFVSILVLGAECFLFTFICLNVRLLSPSQLTTWLNYNQWKERQNVIHAGHSIYLYFWQNESASISQTVPSAQGGWICILLSCISLKRFPGMPSVCLDGLVPEHSPCAIRMHWIKSHSL